MPITAAAIEAAYDRITPHIRVTPLLQLRKGDLGLPFAASLKLENLQHSGSFKARGAFNSLLSHDVPLAGVAAASGGNHGAAVAYAARTLDIPARIFVPRLASPAKITRIRSYGADIEITGATYAEARKACEDWQSETGALDIHAYDAEATIIGQGTLALEWEGQSRGLDTLFVAVGGGGLISGIATWFAGKTRVIGVEPEGCRSLSAALAAGSPVDVDVSGVAADSLGARRCGELVYDICRVGVDDVIIVSDDDIREAQRRLWREAQIVAEPGGAAALAALTGGHYTPQRGERIGILVCGGNADLASLSAPVLTSLT
ncbi:MAG: threonine/serine dehydratase [Pannonibacter sp.]